MSCIYRMKLSQNGHMFETRTKDQLNAKVRANSFGGEVLLLSYKQLQREKRAEENMNWWTFSTKSVPNSQSFWSTMVYLFVSYARGAGEMGRVDKISDD